jgi:hypothetical protein
MCLEMKVMFILDLTSELKGIKIPATGEAEY